MPLHKNRLAASCLNNELRDRTNEVSNAQSKLSNAYMRRAHESGSLAAGLVWPVT